MTTGTISRIQTLALAVIAIVCGAVAVQAEAVTVVGQNDVLVDRQSIQDAIDTAGQDATIRLVGAFQLDGERILIGSGPIRLEGSAIDNDGDDRTNEDWVDGVDNDGDGVIDEDDWDTKISGVANPDGSPVLNDGFNGLFNRGFVVDGADEADSDVDSDTDSDSDSDSDAKGILIRGIAFSTFHHAINLIPEWSSPTGRCEDRMRVDGSLDHVRIEGNKFEGNELGIVIQGAVHRSTVARNLFLNTGLFGVVFEGEVDDCPFADGGSVDLTFSRPQDNTIRQNTAVSSILGTFNTDRSRIDDNTITDAFIGVFSTFDRKGRLRDNATEGCGIGIVVEGGERTLIKGNRVSGGLIGIELSDIRGSSKPNSLIDNTIEDTGLFGLNFTFGASNHLASGNEVSGSAFVDVFLDFDTSSNTVINQGDLQTAFDLGIDNQLIGNFVQF